LSSAEAKAGLKVIPVFISIDPERDTVEQVREYLRGKLIHAVKPFVQGQTWQGTDGVVFYFISLFLCPPLLFVCWKIYCSFVVKVKILLYILLKL
jgi:hypothetical protein